MEPSALPPEVAEIERRLAARPVAEPASDHRARVMDAVRAELAARRVPWWRRADTWRFAAAAAAVLALWANVAISTGGRSLSLAPEPQNGHAVQRAAEQLRTLVPELSHREALRHVVALRVGVPQAALPQPAGGTSLAHYKEVQSWDME